MEKIYFASIIDINEYHETCVMISINSCNNYDIIGKMPFYVFNNFLIHYNTIKERENKNMDDGDSNMSENFTKIQQTAKSSLNTAKKSIPKQKYKI